MQCLNETNMEHCKLSEADKKVLLIEGYNVERLLKEGSYGLVYLAEYTSPTDKNFPTDVGGKVALKVMGTDEQPMGFLTKLLPRELTIHSRLSHPHIVQLHSALQIAGKVIIATRYVERGTLLDHLMKYGELREKQARLWFRQLALALSYLHAIKVAHRDVKPENILISWNNNVKLSDFGFSRYCADSKGVRIYSRTYCGSLPYAAPELTMGVIYDPRNADMWALGIVLYVMLNGCLPFRTEKLMTVLKLQLTGCFRFRTKVMMRVSAEAVDLVRALLEPNWLKRLTVDDALKSPWIGLEPKLLQLTSLEEAALLDLENFNMKNPIKIEKLTEEAEVELEKKDDATIQDLCIKHPDDGSLKQDNDSTKEEAVSKDPDVDQDVD